MIRNKGMTLPLLVAALAIWGIIAYKIVASRGTDSTAEAGQTSPALENVAGREELGLDYPDPFLRKCPVAGEASGCVQQAVARETELQEVPPSFRFRGGICKKRQKFLLLEYRGEVALYPYDGLPGGYTVRNVAADSVVVAGNGRCYTLYLGK